jgi:hypothetical protein
MTFYNVKDLIFVAEGIFDGQNMETKEGKFYPVPENYASKSKLVEGDRMRLYKTGTGQIVFKQIEEITRRYGIGIITEHSSYFTVSFENRSYKILNASINYYKLNNGDKIRIALPKDKRSSWAAIINNL